MQVKNSSGFIAVYVAKKLNFRVESVSMLAIANLNIRKLIGLPISLNVSVLPTK